MIIYYIYHHHVQFVMKKAAHSCQHPPKKLSTLLTQYILITFKKVNSNLQLKA